MALEKGCVLSDGTYCGVVYVVGSVIVLDSLGALADEFLWEALHEINGGSFVT